ncbi:hypothetical protein SH449x_000711 [Pirellulaceae bacterium SH449]
MQRFLSWLVVPAFLLVSSVSHAHFPWLIKDKEGRAVLYFGENLADTTYKIPGSIAAAKIVGIDEKGERHEVNTTRVETTELVGLVSSEPQTQLTSLSSEVTFGIYNGGRLNYYCNHLAVHPTSGVSASNNVSNTHRLTARIVATTVGIDVYAVWDGKPLKDIEIKLYCAEGHEEGSAKTDAEGKVFFNSKQVEAGLNGIMFGTRVEESGQWDGKSYTNSAHYLTATFYRPDFKAE